MRLHDGSVFSVCTNRKIEKKTGKEVNKYSWNYINIQMAWNIYGDSFWFMQFVFKNVQGWDGKQAIFG